MIVGLERYVEHLDLLREDLLPILVIELEKEGLILVETAPVKENSLQSLTGGTYEKDNKDIN